MAVSVLAQGVDMPIHILQIALHREAVETKISRKPVLPDLVDALDFAFCLRAVCEEEGYLIDFSLQAKRVVLFSLLPSNILA